MGAQAAIQRRAFVTLGEQRAAIAIGAQRLGRKEACGRGIRRGTQCAATLRAAKTLRQVIQREQSLARGDVA